MHDGWVSVAEAEQLSGKSARTLRRWAAAGKLQVQYDSEGHTLYQLADLDTGTGHVRPSDRPVSVPLAEVVHPDEHAETQEHAQALQMARRVGELEAEAHLLREDRNYWRDHAVSLTERAHAAELALAQELAARTAIEAERDRLATLVAGHDRTQPDIVSGQVSDLSTPDSRPAWRLWWRRLLGRN